MPSHNPESKFVKRVMPNASEKEIEEATRRWFGFLQTVDRIRDRLEREGEWKEFEHLTGKRPKGAIPRLRKLLGLDDHTNA